MFLTRGVLIMKEFSFNENVYDLNSAIELFEKFENNIWDLAKEVKITMTEYKALDPSWFVFGLKAIRRMGMGDVYDWQKEKIAQAFESMYNTAAEIERRGIKIMFREHNLVKLAFTVVE